MKFSAKAAAAAVAMATMAMSGAASAASATDLLLEVYDPTSTNTVVIDLGIAAPTSAINQSFTLASLSSAWTTFFVPADASVLQWFLIGGSSAAAAGGGDISVITGGQTAIGAASNANTLFGNGSGASTVTIAGSTSGASGAILASSNANAFPNITTTGSIGGNAPNQVFDLATNPLDLIRYSSTNLAGTFLESATLNASAGTLTLGTVPEPGTYALMAAGLLAVGAIVRRRSRS